MEIELVPIFLALLCLFIISWYLKHKNQAIYHWPLLGTLPLLHWNSNRLPEWINEVFFFNGHGSFLVDGPVFSKLRYLVTCHPENIEYILKTNYSNFPKGPEFKEIFDILGDGIFNADSSSWHTQRKMGYSAISTAEFRNQVAKESRRMVKDQLVPFLSYVAREGIIIDFQDVCMRYAFDSSTRVIFGISEGYLSIDLPRNELSDAVDDSHEVLLHRHTMPKFWWKILRWLSIGKEKKMSTAWKTIDAIITKYIIVRRESLCKGIDASDMLSMYIKSPEELCKNDIFLRDTILNMFTAGRDTIASGLTWLLWLVTKTPHVEAKILEELKLIAKKDGSNIKFPWVFDSDDLKGLVYLHAALNESLRLYPPVPLNSKGVLKEDVLPDGSVVKPGMQIILSFYSEGRMPWIWGEDSLEFKPERWIDHDGKIAHEPLSKFFTFNVGPRTCLGKGLAYTQLKSAVAAILFNFHIEVMEGQEIGLKPYITLHMKNKMLVKIREREMLI
ncbi:hypothetical protein GIB67_005427 [Kingdonia uniflora]|uniref:Cytochrome P450 n=1 Tax=Kingdonia uniflora TaxID=39325 RepID=A0A7J7NHA6_9MAGN|nr:hypothetical protein GIB67_005427 [Kingdonia uniflora]